MVVRLSDSDMKKLNLSRFITDDSALLKKSIKSKTTNKKTNNTQAKLSLIKGQNNSLSCLGDFVDFDKQTKSLTITLCDAKTISHNEILRQHYASLNGYNKSWYNRISNVIKRNKCKIELWVKSVGSDLLLFEGLEYSKYIRDTDSSSGSFKPLVDGLVRAGLVQNDSPEYLLIMPPFPVKSNEAKIVLRLRPCPNLSLFFSSDFVAETVIG